MISPVKSTIFRRLLLFLRTRDVPTEVISYTLLVGSFPFAGRDGDTAMLQRISAGKQRGIARPGSGMGEVMDFL